MKRTSLTAFPKDVPTRLLPYLADAHLYDSSCSPQARVIFIDRGDGYYLKSAPAGTLAREAEMTRYFHSKGLGAEVLDYCSDTRDWLLTARVPGEDCTHAVYLEDPIRLCDLLATRLRALHEICANGCPVQDRMKDYFALAEANYRKGAYDTSYFSDYSPSATADEIWREVRQARECFKNDTLLHGDYCLPNIILNDWRFSGFIDVGNGGVGDRHVDLYWGAWTLRYNLKTDRYRERFFDAYGRDRIDLEGIRAVAACETFG